MSSATPSGGANQATYALADKMLPARTSARVAKLQRLYSHFRCETYDHLTTDWNGDPILSLEEKATVARDRQIPPGFYDPFGQMLPLSMRRPDAPYYLVNVIVHRFTGLLFSHKRNPRVKVLGDDLTEDWLSAVVEVGRLWPQMIEARNLGGAMGAVAIGFQVVRGTPVFEVHDPRFCTPQFKNRITQELSSIEIRWKYTDYVHDPDSGLTLEVEFWNRRVIDDKTDTLWQAVPVGDGSEPEWDKFEPLAVEHGLGECPVIWIQNRRVAENIDGDPDCLGAYDTIEKIDALNAQANKGIISNCDPTLVIATEDGDLPPQLQKGSGNFIRVGKGEQAEYLEITGAGPKAATEQADRLEERVLRMCRCVIEQAKSFTAKTATEVQKDYSSMHEAADVLREHYGERGVKRLLEIVLRAALILGKRNELIVLPPKVESDGALTPRKLGSGGFLTLSWPAYETPTPTEIAQAVTAATTAKQAELVDASHASQSVATYFGVEDVDAMLAEMAEAKRKSDEEYAASIAAPTAAGSTESDTAKFYQYELESGAITLNELRASKGLPPLSMDGDLTLPQYRAKYASTFAQSTVASSPDGAEKLLGMGDESAA